MQFSSKLATAVHILLYIQEYQEEEKITSEVLADSTGVNPVNIRKILAKLKQAQLITVKPGIGGTFLKKSPEEITLRMLFEAVEEPEIQLFRMHEHPNTDCPVGRTISSVLNDRLNCIQAGMFEDMGQMKLSDMYADMKKRLKDESA